MSKHLVNLVYSKLCGSPMRKAVLVAMADRANDDGSGVYVSRTRIAAEVECSRQTVFNVCRDMEADGILFAVGRKAGRRGYTTIYQISVRNLKQLPDSWAPADDDSTLDANLGEDADDCDAENKASNGLTLPKSKASKPRSDSVNGVGKNRPYRTIEKHAGASERANGPSADRPDGSSSGPSQADFRRMAADPEFARDHRDVIVEESPRSKLATLRDELETLERIHAKYPELSGSDYSTRRDRLLGEISQLENSEN